MSTTSVMIVGVGGQGTLLAARILGHLLLSKGYDVRISEVHGMSQRGGSVLTHVRYGEKVFSPITDEGEADYIVAFETLEAARYVSYLKEDGVLLTSRREMPPMPVLTGAAVYPENLVEKLRAIAHVRAVDALTLAKKAGSAKSVNVVMLGLLSNEMPFSVREWEDAIAATVKPNTLCINQKAFLLGREASREDRVGGGD